MIEKNRPPMNWRYCTCGHAAQIHGANDRGYLQHNRARGQGRCSANQCPCDNYTPRQTKDPTP